MVGAFIHIRLK